MLFEYQKFERNPELQSLIDETEARYSGELSDDELSLVAAAGDAFLSTKKPKDKADE